MHKQVSDAHRTLTAISFIHRLRMEIETIPEYIAIYHAERAALKAKFLDKDVHIAELAALQERQIQVRALWWVGLGGLQTEAHMLTAMGNRGPSNSNWRTPKRRWKRWRRRTASCVGLRAPTTTSRTPPRWPPTAATARHRPALWRR